MVAHPLAGGSHLLVVSAMAKIAVAGAGGRTTTVGTTMHPAPTPPGHRR